MCSWHAGISGNNCPISVLGVGHLAREVEVCFKGKSHPEALGVVFKYGTQESGIFVCS